MQKKIKKRNEPILGKKDVTVGQTARHLNGAIIIKPSIRACIILPTSRSKIRIFHPKVCNFKM